MQMAGQSLSTAKGGSQLALQTLPLHPPPPHPQPPHTVLLFHVPNLHLCEGYSDQGDSLVVRHRSLTLEAASKQGRSETVSCLIVSICDPMEPASLLSPWNSAGENTGVGCHSLFQGIFLTQGSSLGLLRWQTGSLPLSPHQKGFPLSPFLIITFRMILLHVISAYSHLISSQILQI